MDKIITLKDAAEISNKLKNQGKSIVLVGGCFDILHIGHILFLEAAKKKGDILMILLESDESIREKKGHGRPINTQYDRAAILQALGVVDYVISLPKLETNHQYDECIKMLKPAIIATTKGDPGRMHKVRQAAQVNAEVLDVTEKIQNASSSRLVRLLGID